MASSVQVLEGEDILMIKRTNIVRKYQSETEGFKDKSYRVYAFGDKAFAVHEDDNFHKDLENGNVKSVQITVTDEGWSLAKHVTWLQAANHKRNTLLYDSLTIENFSKPETVAALNKFAAVGD